MSDDHYNLIQRLEEYQHIWAQDGVDSDSVAFGFIAGQLGAAAARR